MRVSLESEAMVSQEPNCDLRLSQTNLDLTLSDSGGTLLTLPYSQAALLLNRLSSEAHIQRLRRWAERSAPQAEALRLEVSREKIEIGGTLKISFRSSAQAKAVLLSIDALGTVSLLRITSGDSFAGGGESASLRVAAGPPAGALDLCLLLLEQAPEGFSEMTDIKPATADFADLVLKLREARPMGGLLRRVEVTSLSH